jgi:mannose/cellobiose epimerase-like protein (N-acyl-D-glucosamine 2-epimerase family)
LFKLGQKGKTEFLKDQFLGDIFSQDIEELFSEGSAVALEKVVFVNPGHKIHYFWLFIEHQLLIMQKDQRFDFIRIGQT